MFIAFEDSKRPGVVVKIVKTLLTFFWRVFMTHALNFLNYFQRHEGRCHVIDNNCGLLNIDMKMLMGTILTVIL